MKRSQAKYLACWGLWAAIGCGGSSTKPAASTDGFDRHALLSHWGRSVILLTYRQFAGEVQALESAVTGYVLATSAGTGDAESTRLLAQQAWRTAMATWQQAEMFLLGPAGMPATFSGGQALRDPIYAWPSVSPCRIDQHIFAEDYVVEGFFATASVSAVGLGALEYLLFNQDPGNRCNSSSPLNQNGAWASLSVEEIGKRRAAFAQLLSQQLARAATQLQKAWESPQESGGAGDGFVDQLTNAGQGSEVFDSAQMALDEMFAALFDLDLRVKDDKLGVPSGIDPSCTQATCPESLESPWSDHAKDNIANNLLGFQRIFLGDSETPSLAPGFDDWLRERGAEDVAVRMAAGLASARQAVAGIPGTLRQAIEQNPEAVGAAHAAIKVVTDSMKSELVTVLNLRVPQQGAGDND